MYVYTTEGDDSLQFILSMFVSMCRKGISKILYLKAKARSCIFCTHLRESERERERDVFVILSLPVVRGCCRTTLVSDIQYREIEM